MKNSLKGKITKMIKMQNFIFHCSVLHSVLFSLSFLSLRIFRWYCMFVHFYLIMLLNFGYFFVLIGFWLSKHMRRTADCWATIVMYYCQKTFWLWIFAWLSSNPMILSFLNQRVRSISEHLSQYLKTSASHLQDSLMTGDDDNIIRPEHLITSSLPPSIYPPPLCS